MAALLLPAQPLRSLFFVLVIATAMFSTASFGQKPADAARKASAVSVFANEKLAEQLTAEGSERKFFPAAARTPLEATLGFRKYMQAGDYATAAQYLDLRYIPENVAAVDPEKLARALAFVWNQQNVLDLTAISDNPNGHLDDELPEYRDEIGLVQMSDGVIPIYVQHVPDGEGGQVWRISNATVAQIPEMWAEHGYSEYAIKLSNMLPDFMFLGMQNWQVVLLLVALVVHWFLSGIITRILAFFTLRIPNQFPSGIRRFWAIPMRLIAYVLLFRFTIQHLGLSVSAKVYLQSSPLEYIAGTVFITGLITLWRDYKFRKLESAGDTHYIALLKPMVLIIKILVFITAVLVWAHNAGFNISTIIAGLGVGSLAVALAAQRTMENVIGAATLYAARPIRPGDFCKFGDIKGTVEEIGLRSVTLRTQDRTLVSIPNAKFSSDSIENISVRDRIRFFRQLQLQMPTSTQLRVILGELRAMFSAHPKVQQDTVSIRLENIEAATAVLRIDAGVMTRDFQEYLAIAEDLNLRIIETVHGNGAIFSGPGQVLQLREFYQASDETMAQVDAKLQGWRDEHELPFPDFSAARKEQIKDSIQYPPQGAPSP